MENTENKTISKTKTKKVLGIIAIILSIIVAFAGGFFTRHFITTEEQRITGEIIGLIEEYGYIIDENGNLKNLSESDYANALKNGLLDEYAKYYSKSEYEKIKKQQKGQYSGFGFSITEKDEYPLIVNVIGNSPAEEAGLKKGDKLISASVGEQYAQFNQTKISDFLNGFSSGTQVVFEVDRDGNRLFITVIKASYKATYVKYFDNQGRVFFDLDNGSYQIDESQKIDVDDKTALIQIDSFEGDVAYQLGKAMDYMQNNNRTKLILDLRDNGGGYMDDFIAVSKHLIYNKGQKTLLAYADGKHENESFYMNSPVERQGITDMAVLANDGTASASESLIGALLCYGEKNFSVDRLILEKNEQGVAKTFGKGIMQTTYLLSNGGAFKLTTAKLFWPNKTTCIHGTGITTIPENQVERGGDALIRAKQILT